MKKSLLLMAGILDVALVGSAQAATMFAVQNSGGADQATISDTGAIATLGTITAPKIGVGTVSPASSFHSAESITTASRGIMASQHNDGAQAASIVFRKSRGTETAPTTPILNDYIGVFAAQFFNGSIYDRAAQFAFQNDGAPSGVAFPTMISFFTGSHTSAPSDLSEKFRISSAGNVVAGNLGGTAVADLATSATNGFLYIPNVAGSLTSCASVATYTGHVPVWFDTTNSKICTCQSGALKCTAALN